MKEKLQFVILVIALAGSIVGAINYFAKAEEVKHIEMRLDMKILSDSIAQVYQRMWQLEDRNGDRDCSKWLNLDDKEEYRKLEVQLEEAKKNYDTLIQKVKK